MTSCKSRYRLPPGTVVFLALGCANRSMKDWGEDADLFVPERWLGKREGGLSHLAFGYGSRGCVSLHTYLYALFWDSTGWLQDRTAWDEDVSSWASQKVPCCTKESWLQSFAGGNLRRWESTCRRVIWTPSKAVTSLDLTPASRETMTGLAN